MSTSTIPEGLQDDRVRTQTPPTGLKDPEKSHPDPGRLHKEDGGEKDDQASSYKTGEIIGDDRA